MWSVIFILLKFLPGMLGDNKYFIIMYKNKETVSRSATNSEDNHAAILSCKKNKNRFSSERARTLSHFWNFCRVNSAEHKRGYFKNPWYKAQWAFFDFTKWNIHRLKMGKIKLKCSGSFLFLSHCGWSLKPALRNDAPSFGRFSPCYKEENNTFFPHTNRQNNNMQQEVESTVSLISLFTRTI